ncbi:MAG: isoprenylcysteine carboxylmethyltransferase family protein [Beijerinckiaceae bacterium]|nr:isoprenylcysteine carboxylmethyltransferase family protein [Beijerinckiaceae bacterium]
MDLSERPNRLPWPPMIYTCACALAWLLQGAAPLLPLDGVLAAIPAAFGVLAAIAGFGLDVAAMWGLARHRTAILPNAGASALVSGGVFAWSRNPIYLGNTIMLAGFAIALRWGWLALAAPLTMIAVTRLAIVREEAHLAMRFGEDWRAYAARVRRWL